MTWRIVARTDISNIIKWKLFIGLTLLLAFLINLQTPRIADATGTTATHAALGAHIPSVLTIPIFALALSYGVFIRDREHGRLATLLSLPMTRTDVFVGKLVSRIMVVATMILGAYVLTALLLVILFQSVPFMMLGRLAISGVVVGLLSVALGIAISAIARTSTSALTAVLGIYLFTVIWWREGFRHYVLLFIGGWEEVPAAGDFPAWYVIGERVFPVDALYFFTRQFILDGQQLTAEGGMYSIDQAPPGQAQVAGDAPFFVHDWFLFVIVASYAVIVLALGYWRFMEVNN